MSYRISEEKEDYTTTEDMQSMDIDIDPELTGAETSLQLHGRRFKSNLRLPPPPLFSRQAVPHLYKFVCAV